MIDTEASTTGATESNYMDRRT